MAIKKSLTTILNSEDIKEELMPDFVSRVNGANKKVNTRFFYRISGSCEMVDNVDIITLIDKDNDVVENKIYSSQFDILNKYHDSDTSISFQLIPKYQSNVGDLIPNGFTRYRHASK